MMVSSFSAHALDQLCPFGVIQRLQQRFFTQALPYPTLRFGRWRRVCRRVPGFRQRAERKLPPHNSSQAQRLLRLQRQYPDPLGAEEGHSSGGAKAKRPS
jgi:hypothetical protein